MAEGSPDLVPLTDFQGHGEAWDELLEGAGRCALEQSWAYGEAIASRHGWQPRRLVAGDPARPAALAQVLERRVLGPFSVARLLRGPVERYGFEKAAARDGLYRALSARYRLRNGRALFWMPELPDEAESLALMRRAGRRRSVTAYTTAWLDLDKEESALRAGLHGKWRNALAGAEDRGLRVSGGGETALDWLLAQHDAQRKARRFVAPDGLFYGYLARAAGNLRTRVYQARAGNEPASGALFFRHGSCATYAVGWSGNEGRRLNAQTLLLWRALLDLKDRGVRWLDLGGLTAEAEGVARFKLGLGATPSALAGTFF